MAPPMDSISEDEAENDHSICCCLPGKKRSNNPPNGSQEASSDNKNYMNNDGAVRTTPNDRGLEKYKSKRQSVFTSAREFLDQSQLDALKDFEDAVINIGFGGDESLYFDALDATDDNPTSEETKYHPAKAPNRQPRNSILMDDPATLLKALTEPKVKIDDPGYPGQLTAEELEAVKKLRSEVNERKKDAENDGKVYHEMLRVFDPVEPEPYALCRFLRSRQFNVEKVFAMIDQFTDLWRGARVHNFFPDADACLGCPEQVFLTQFPMIYSGQAKSGATVSYFKASTIAVEGIECLTNVETMEDYSWHLVVHKFPKEVAKDPENVRCEVLQVIDLNGMSASVLNKRTLEVMKKTFAGMGCFPELLSGMVILNAPSFFAFFWRIIKATLDPRTANKIQIFAHDGRDWLTENIDSNSLLKDYGGDGETFVQTLLKQSGEKTSKRQVVKLFAISSRSTDSFEVALKANETVDLTVYTRSTSGAEFLVQNEVKERWKTSVISPDGASKPYSVTIIEAVKGPVKLTISPTAKSWSTDYFLLAGKVR